MATPITPLPDQARELLEKLRVAKKLSPQELARRSGVGRSTIVDFLHGKTVPKLDTFDALIRALDFEVVLEVRPVSRTLLEQVRLTLDRRHET